MNPIRLTVGITTRDRPKALERCLRSLSAIEHLATEVLIFDDASTTPIDQQLAGRDVPVPFRVLRADDAPGMIVGRNRMVREANAPAVLLLDDDAGLIDGQSIDQAVRLLDNDPHVGAIAFAQSDRHGTRWDDSMQPSRSHDACYVPAFIGFAHLVRRDVFLSMGGYRETFFFYGEEKDFCLRLMDAGYRTVYLPNALVMHEPDPAGRSQQRYLRYVTRNDCLTALYNEPWYRLVWMLPGRLALYFRMRHAWKVADPWGWAWILRELAANSGSVMRDRRPVSSETLVLWKQLRQMPQLYRMNLPEPKP
jgi:GT2 family glycosyltransferase